MTRMAKKKPGKKMRVEFRQNRQVRQRTDDWTRRFHQDADSLSDDRSSESVRAKGELSRKRTVMVDADDDSHRVDEALWTTGVVLKVHGLIAFVDVAGVVWECTVRRILRTLLIDQRSPVTVGDHVWFSDLSGFHDGRPVGVIERVAPRRSALSRRERRGREHALVANTDQLLIVASVAYPRLKPHLIDRYIVAALKGGMTPIVCFTKTDLLDEDAAAPAHPSSPDERAEEHEEWDELAEMEDADAPAEDDASERSTTAEDQADDWAAGVDRAAADAGDAPDDDGEFIELDDTHPLAVFEELSQLGYRCLWTSARSGAGLEELRAALTGHMTVLSGQSGVGKSSLLNAIQPGLMLAVGEVSIENEKGRHTTTHASLLPLETGGYVVDTPGIRAFDLWNLNPGELEALFVEFPPLVAQCRFADCLHQGEAGCAVAAAVEAGQISPRRYYSYRKMLSDALARPR